MSTFVLSVRLNAEEEKQLNELSKVLNMTKAETIRHCVRSGWMSYNQQSEETKKALKQFNALSDFVESLLKQ